MQAVTKSAKRHNEKRSSKNGRKQPRYAPPRYAQILAVGVRRTCALTTFSALTIRKRVMESAKDNEKVRITP